MHAIHSIVDLNVVTLDRDRIKPTHFKKILRTDHLNEEERNAFFNLCAMLHQLTFTNMVRYPINTTVPIYIKPYRYGFKGFKEKRN